MNHGEAAISTLNIVGFGFYTDFEQEKLVIKKTQLDNLCNAILLNQIFLGPNLVLINEKHCLMATHPVSFIDVSDI